MNNVDNVELKPEYILKLTETVRNSMMEINKATNEILICSYDELEENIDKRDAEFEKAKENFEALKALDNGEDAAFHEIMAGNADYEKLSDIYRKIYDGRRSIKLLSEEIRSKDVLVSEKLAECRDVMLEEIKKLNSGTEATASKYYSSSSPIPQKNVYFPRQDRKI